VDKIESSLSSLSLSSERMQVKVSLTADILDRPLVAIREACFLGPYSLP